MNKIIFAIIATTLLTGFKEYGKLDQTPITKKTVTEIRSKSHKQNEQLENARLEKVQTRKQEKGIKELRGKQ